MISVFKASDRQFIRYLGDDKNESGGHAWIARLVRDPISNTIGAGVVIYERITVEWDFPFDEFITVIEGALRVRSAGSTYDLSQGDMAWFPAHTPLTYEVGEREVVGYSVYPLPPPPGTDPPIGMTRVLED